MATTFIYALVDPRTTRPKYIGKSGKPIYRFSRHLKGTRNPHLQAWIAQLAAEGMQPTLSIIEEVEADQWEERERHWIAFYRAKGIRLCNVDDGGYQGPSRKGVPLSDEHKAKISAALKGRKQPPELVEKVAAALRGRPLSAAHSAKIAAALKGKPKSPEHIKKVLESRAGWKPTPEQTAKRLASRASGAGFAQSAATKKRISKTMKGVPKTEEHRANMRKK